MVRFLSRIILCGGSLSITVCAVEIYDGSFRCMRYLHIF